MNLFFPREWDEQILCAVVENEGVTESVIEKLQLQIPIKSITEVNSSKLLLISIDGTHFLFEHKGFLIIAILDFLINIYFWVGTVQKFRLFC